jgi:drug/metabolite transporter (DMT)-like permease
MTALLVAICVLSWGVWTLAEARAIADLGRYSALAWGYVLYGLVGLGMTAAQPVAPLFDRPWAAALAVLCSCAGIGAYLALLQRIPPASAAALTCFYPIVPALWAAAHGRAPGPGMWVGIALICAGVAAVSLFS